MEAPEIRGGGSMGGGGDVVQGLWEPSHNDIVLQIHMEGDIILGKRLSVSGI